MRSLQFVGRVCVYILYTKIKRPTIALWGIEIHGPSFTCLRSQY